MYTSRPNLKLWSIVLILMYTSLQTNGQTNTVEPTSGGDETEGEGREESLPETSETPSVPAVDEGEEGNEEPEKDDVTNEETPITKLETTPSMITAEEAVTHAPLSEESSSVQESGLSSEEPSPTKESEPKKEEAPESTFALEDAGKICLLAKFEAEFTISYQSKEGKQSVVQSLPKSAKPEGGCSDNKNRTLRLSWGKFSFTMIFSKVEKNEDSDEKWAVTELALFYDTSKKPFVSALNGLKSTARSEDDLKLFETSVGKSYLCQSPEVIKLYVAKKDVAFIRFKDMKLQPFGVKDGKFSPSHRCSQVVFTGTEEPFVQDETVALAVGLTLAILTLLVVLGFSIYRAYTVRKVDYNSME